MVSVSRFFRKLLGPAEVRENGASHYPIFVCSERNVRFLGEMDDALLVGDRDVISTRAPADDKVARIRFRSPHAFIRDGVHAFGIEQVLVQLFQIGRARSFDATWLEALLLRAFC